MPGLEKIVFGGIGEGLDIPLLTYFATIRDPIGLMATIGAATVFGYRIADGIVEKVTGYSLWYYQSGLHKRTYLWCQDIKKDREMCRTHHVKWLK